MDVITVKIKITNEELTIEEKTEVIKSNLKSLIDQLEQQNGNIQQAKAKNEDSSIEYVHLKKS